MILLVLGFMSIWQPRLKISLFYSAFLASLCGLVFLVARDERYNVKLGDCSTADGSLSSFAA